MATLPATKNPKATFANGVVTFTWENQINPSTGFVSGSYVDIYRETWPPNFIGPQLPVKIARVPINAISYEDSAVQRNYTYYYEARPYNPNHTTPTVPRAKITLPPYPPAAPSALSVALSGQKKAIVKFSRNATVNAPVDQCIVERKVRNGAWQALYTLTGSGSQMQFEDDATSIDSGYSYRVRNKNSSGYSGWVESAIMYTLPRSPSKPTFDRKGLPDGQIAVILGVSSQIADGAQIQRSTDKVNWTTAVTSNVASTVLVDSPPEGVFYYRARYLRGTSASAWSDVSDAVATMCRPSAPDLIEPMSGALVEYTDEPIEFRWRHQSLDESDQTEAQLQYSTDGVDWIGVDVDSDMHVLLDNDFENNSTIYWRVRTKGIDPEFGPWSGVRQMFLKSRPVIELQSPGAIIDRLPFAVSFDYEDASGDLVDTQVDITDLDTGAYVFRKSAGASTYIEVPKEQFVPVDGREYLVEVVCRSSSGMTVSFSQGVVASFTPPKVVTINVDVDADRGFAIIRCVVDDMSAGEDVVSMSIFRVNGDDETLIATDLQGGQQVVDRYAPVNKDYAYRVIAYAESGAAREVQHKGSIKTPYAFFYFGDGGIARAMFDPADPRKHSSPQRDLVHYAGRKYPVMYNTKARDQVHSFSAHVIGQEEIDAFDYLGDAGRCFYKSVSGIVFHAACDVDVTPDLTHVGSHADVTISLTRIEGESL